MSHTPEIQPAHYGEHAYNPSHRDPAGELSRTMNKLRGGMNRDILEVLSPADGIYTVIHDRRDECQHSFADTLKALSRFCGMDSGHPPR